MAEGDNGRSVWQPRTQSCAGGSVGNPSCSPLCLQQGCTASACVILESKMQRFLYTKARLRTNIILSGNVRGWARWRCHFKGVRYTGPSGRYPAMLHEKWRPLRLGFSGTARVHSERASRQGKSEPDWESNCRVIDALSLLEDCQVI